MDMNLILDVKRLKKYFPVYQGVFFPKLVAQVKAVNDISFQLRQGEILGLVGESGCGKSTTVRSILQIHQPTAGEISFYREGESPVSLEKLNPRAIRPYRRYLQMIFQDPYSSLNPRMTVGNIITEPLRALESGISKNDFKDRQKMLMEMVGLDYRFINRYPHQFSGGQRQRIGIARAISPSPEVIFADEPVSALDVSIQAQIINLLLRLREQLSLSLVVIAHDLAVVRHISDRIIVMYLGKIVEEAGYQEIFKNPLHPYTQALLSAIPIPDPVVEKKRQRILLEGDIPSPSDDIRGCPFYSRCRLRMDVCQEKVPPLESCGNGHRAACWKVNGV